MSQQFILNSLSAAKETLDGFISDPKNLELIDSSIQTLVHSFKNGGRVMSCGNGGSMCDSMHFAEELTGRYRKDRAPLAAMPMGDPSHITCVANDYGFNYIFSRNVEAWGNAGDVLLAISTSGNSANIIEAVKSAKAKGMKVIGLLGKDGGALKEIVDIPIIVKTMATDRIQEIHIKCIHIFIEGVERSLFPEHY